MKTKLIKKHNPQSFLDDLKRVREVMVYAECTNSYYQILKKDLLRDAERKAITYYITDSPALVVLTWQPMSSDGISYFSLK